MEKQIKRPCTFADLRGTCLCCTSHCKCGPDWCKGLYRFALTGRGKGIDLPRPRSAAMPLQTDGRRRRRTGGACSERHMLSGLLMALQRRAQFCLDCSRTDSSGQLASLCGRAENKKTKNTLFNKGVKERGKERRKPNKEKYFVYHDGFNPSCK